MEEVGGVAVISYLSALISLLFGVNHFDLILTHLIIGGSQETDAYANTANGPIGAPSLSLYSK